MPEGPRFDARQRMIPKFGGNAAFRHAESAALAGTAADPNGQRAARETAAQERAEERRAGQQKYREVITALDRNYRFDTDGDAVNTKPQDPGAVAPADVRRALIVAMQEVHPEKSVDRGGLTAELRHHAGGIGFRSNARNGIEVNVGIRSVDRLICTPVAANGATCTFAATRVSSAVHRDLGGTARTVMDTLANSLDVAPTETARFRERLVFRDNQWRLASPSPQLADFLSATAPELGSRGESDFGCGMALAVGLDGFC